MKTAPATVTRASPLPVAGLLSRMMTSAFLSTLSFSAEKNCAQNSGAKRRDDIKSLIMTSPVLETLSEVVSLSDGRRDRRRGDGHWRVDDDRPGLLCAFAFRSCWSPRGVVWFANGWSRLCHAPAGRRARLR